MMHFRYDFYIGGFLVALTYGQWWYPVGIYTRFIYLG